MDMHSLLLGPTSGPVWAVIGVLVTKLIDIAVGRKKLKRDELMDANSAHANLNKSLVQGFEALRAELERLREEKDHEDQRHREESERYRTRIAELEREVERLLKRVLEEQQMTAAKGD